MHAFWMVICSNSILAIAIAIVALLLGYRWKNPAALHVIWIVVLLKLFTPPIVAVAIPILAVAPLATELTVIADSPAAVSRVGFATRSAVVSATNNDHAAMPASRTIAQETPVSIVSNATISLPSWSALLAMVWIFGSIAVAIRHSLRIRRFAAFIRTCEPAPAEIATLTAQVANRLGLKNVPVVVTTPRAFPPLVWWLASPAQLVLPRELFRRLNEPAQTAIIVHELSHIARRDHLVRMLELLATIVFWWHPVVWLSCWKLRDLEEQCCDSRVLEFAPERSKDYAMALVDTVEFLSEQPAACALLSAAVRTRCSLSRRIKMMAHRQTNRLSFRSAMVVAAVVVCPLTLAMAADSTSKPTPIVKKSAGPPAILEGRVTDEAGKPLAGARVWIAIPETDMRSICDEPNHRQLETKTGSDGRYRIEVPGLKASTKVSIDASKPGYKRLSGQFRTLPGTKIVAISPGATVAAALKLEPSLYISGVVLDEQGRPISGVKISGHIGTYFGGDGGVEDTVSSKDGSFEIFNYSVAPEKWHDNEIARGPIEFFHPGYVSQEIDDIYALAPNQRAGMRIVLPTGYKISGTVLDDHGNPVQHAIVRAEQTTDVAGNPIVTDGRSPERYWAERDAARPSKSAVFYGNAAHRKAVETDANGRFALRGLAKGPTTFSVRDVAIEQKAQRSITVDKDMSGFDFRLLSMNVPPNIKTYDVLGMRLADATSEIDRAFDEDASGAIILDAGKNPNRLGIGTLEKGDIFVYAGEITRDKLARSRVGNVRQFVSNLLRGAIIKGGEKPSVGVVYTFRDVDMDGSNTQHLKLTRDDIKQLQAVLRSIDAERQ